MNSIANLTKYFYSTNCSMVAQKINLSCRNNNKAEKQNTVGSDVPKYIKTLEQIKITHYR